MLSAGIEPASAPSEGAVLSIERREHTLTILHWCSRTDREYAYRNLQFQYTLRIFSSHQNVRQNTRKVFDSVREHKSHYVRLVLSDRIELSSSAPQADVLSIERRERTNTLHESITYLYIRIRAKPPLGQRRYACVRPHQHYEESIRTPDQHRLLREG